MNYLLNEMLEEILVRVDVPELALLRQVNRRLRDFISTPEFTTSYNTRHQATSWLMVQLFTSDSPSIEDGRSLLLESAAVQLHSIELPEPVDIEHEFDEWQNIRFNIVPQFHVMGFNITNVVAVTNNNDGEILFIPSRHHRY
nr:hypothetical protein [Tanacetum cinerariifolium]